MCPFFLLHSLPLTHPHSLPPCVWMYVHVLLTKYLCQIYFSIRAHICLPLSSLPPSFPPSLPLSLSPSLGSLPPSLSFSQGVLTLLKFPYPREVEEPECYDSIRVHAEWGQPQSQQHNSKPVFSVCVYISYHISPLL